MTVLLRWAASAEKQKPTTTYLLPSRNVQVNFFSLGESIVYYILVHVLVPVYVVGGQWKANTLLLCCASIDCFARSSAQTKCNQPTCTYRYRRSRNPTCSCFCTVDVWQERLFGHILIVGRRAHSPDDNSPNHVIIWMNHRMNRFVCVRLRLALRVQTSHKNLGSSAGSSELSRGVSNYQLGSTLLPI